MLKRDSLSLVGETFSTPRRAQKRLFAVECNSSKRNLFSDGRNASPRSVHSGNDSDLGPMSPLAFSDRTPSSVASSPDRDYNSPLGTPASTHSKRRVTHWQQYLGYESDGGSSKDGTSPFSALKMITRSARYSQLHKIRTASLGTGSPVMGDIPTTPERKNETDVDSSSSLTNTPRRSFGREIQNVMDCNSEIIAETPPKKDSPVKRLITPLGSVSKEAALPRLHHRKSVNSLNLDGNLSPGDLKENNVLKRSAHDILASAATKLFKSDDNNSIPKARAALFQEQKEEFKLSTKSFYSKCSLTAPPPKREQSVNVAWKDFDRINKRRSWPNNPFSRKKTSKKRKYGEINAGISHAIKKPKVKKHVSRSESFKKGKISHSRSLPLSDVSFDKSSENILTKSTNVCPQKSGSRKRNRNASMVSKKLLSKSINVELSPEKIDPNKKFFKTNRTVKRRLSATITMNDKIKLRVSNGSMKLDPQSAIKHRHKKPKIADLSFDANDLTVDDPAIGAPVTENRLAEILKTLEDDWAVDDYDSMTPLSVSINATLSPLKSLNIPNDVMMSPASELSNMTSVMNIEDAAAPTNSKEISQESNDLCNDQPDPIKYFPLFDREFVRNNKNYGETSTTNDHSMNKSNKWQLSLKNGSRIGQYQLDAGQKKFGATQCTECGVVYQIGDPEDENSHLNYHNSVKILKFPGWKQERVVTTDPYTASRIILVEPGDAKHCWKKISDVLAVVDRDLGLADMQISDYNSNKIYLYIRDKEIIGVLAAEYVATAHRMIPDITEIDCCSSEASPVKCGVNVVWTTMNYRRQGIASKLVDILRSTFYFGYVLSMDDIAFSMPTPAGKAFAINYTKSPNFKVYN